MMPSHLLRTILHALGSLGLAVTMLGCGNGTVTAMTLKAPIVWIVALDITPTVPKAHFAGMRDQMLPAVVLARLRSRDEVHTLPVDSDPEQHVRVTRLIQNRRLDKEITALFASLRTEFVRPERYKGTTNLGGVLSYVKRTRLLFEEDSTRAQSNGKPRPPTPQFVVTIFTDGLPDGRQTIPPAGPWPADVSVWFWGVEREHETALMKWATTAMGLPPSQVRIVRFTDWQTAEAQVFGPSIDRPTPQPEIRKRLGVQ